MQSHVLAALFFERHFRYFGSLHPAFEMSCDTEYLLKKLFLEAWSSSFCIVCDCFDVFRETSEKNWAISPKVKHQFSKTTLSTFQKGLFEQCFAFFCGCN